MKRNPAIIRRKAFVRRAALVNFVLPVTIRLRNPCDAAQNPAATGTATCTWQGTALNEDTPATANVNLGPSLGQRTIALGGSLAAEVRFNDTFDGGALGNVAIKLLPSTSKFLKTSSVPLLWNSDIGDAGTRSDANYMRALARAGSALNPGNARQGCGDFTSSAPGSTAATPSGYNAFAYGLTPPGSTFGTGNGLPGYPYYDAGGPGGMTTPAGYLPIYPGAEGIDRVRAGSVVGDNDFVGPNPHPFPYTPPVRPGGAYGNASDTVLRTGALDLGIAPPGVQVDGASGTSTPAGATGLDNGPQGTQSIVTGQSGGEANLFGNIPGKGHSIDVTVNLATTINAIARITDQDVFNTPLKSGDPYPAHVFNCRQVWLGGVQNYIPGVRLKGNLRIAPAITKDGKLRIAKATVQSSQDTHLALSACLFPHSPYAKPNANTTLNTAPTIPLASTTGTPGQLGTGLWPQNSDALPESSVEEAYAPSTTYGAGAPTGAKCNTPAWKIVRDAGLTGSVDPLLPASAADGYTTTNSGAQVTVAGDINVPPLNVDVLIGDASDVPASPPPPIPPDTFITAAPAGTTNATSATITFMASQPSATFECRLDFGPWSVCSSPDAMTGLSNGSHTFEVRAKSTGGTYDPSPAAATWTVNTSYTGPITFTGSPPPGNTVTNNPGGGSPSATVPNASVTTPVGGPVSITPTVAGPPPPVGYSFLGQNLTITASPATPGNPLAITLSLDVSGNPGIVTANDVVIFRNGSPIPDCSPNNGQANPDPCVASRSLSGGIATITALTSAASVWNLGEQQPTDGPVGQISEFDLSPTSAPVGIAGGADGNLWYTEYVGNQVGRITPGGAPAGAFSALSGTPGQTTTTGPAGLTLGPDGNVWFLENVAGKLARVTPAGSVTEFPLRAGSGPAQLAVGPDGNFWISLYQGNAIARVTPGGTVTEYPLGLTNRSPRGITLGPDGNLWFAEEATGTIGRITPAGTITRFDTSTPTSQPFWITTGADGNLWFTEGTTDRIGRITPAGTVTTFGGLTAGSIPRQIAPGPDGNLWFTEYGGHRIGRITLSGAVDEYTTPTTPSAPWSIIGGPDGNVWFTELAGRIGRVPLSADAHPVQTWITGGPSGTTTSTDASFSFLASEPTGATFECRLDGASFSACTTPRTYSGLAAGTHTFEVRARDAAGNVDPTPASRTWTIAPPPPPISEFAIAAGSSPVGIVAGADGNLWFSEFNANQVGKIAPSGTGLSEYPVPTGSPGQLTTSGPAGKILGPDGNVWFLEFMASKIARVAPGGTITEYPLPAGSGPAQLVVGPDGNFWVSFLQSSAIAKVSPAGTLLDTYAIAGNPRGITVGPDGNLWFALENAGRIGRITTSGQIATFDVPTPNSQPFWITPGADGALWFTEGTGNKIGRITTSGQITDEYPVPTANSTPKQITTGADSHLYFTEYTAHKIGRITLGGAVTEYSTPTANSAPWSIIGGPDGNVWFTEIGGSSIGRLGLPSDTTAPQTWITGGPPGTSGPSVSFSFLTTEPASATYECRLDGASFSACPSPKTYSGLADGAHTLEVRARDAAGNVDPSPATRAWTVAPLATASGVVYDDVNNNGTKDAGEPGVGGRTVYVDLNGNQQREAGSEPSVTSLASGVWTLDVPTSGGVSGEIRTVLPSGSHCSQPANPGPGDVNCGHSVTFQPNGNYTARDFGLFTIPSSMVALGDSVTRGFGSPPCGIAYCPQNSWSTGTTTAVNSHFQRIRAINPAMTVADNLAVGGSKMVGLQAQVDNAIAQPTDYEYVTIQIGAEDLCESDFADAPGQPDVMTSAVDFHDQFQNALSALMTGLPHARVFVGSLANPQTGYDALAASPNYPAIFANWSARHGCRNVLGDLATTQSRADALARTVAYNQALRDVCAAEAPRCVFDDEWIFNEPASESEVSTADYTHPNVAGQAHYARSYAHGFNWTLAGTAAASGVVYDDINISGAQSTGEPGVNGRTVYVDLNGNQQLDSPAERSTVTQTIAGVQGAWQLTLNDVPVGGVTAQIRTVLASGRRCAQPASPGPAHTDCAYTVNFQRDGVYADRDFGTYDLPASMAALGDSLTQAQHAIPAASWPWPGYVFGGVPSSYPGTCTAAVIGGNPEPRLWDCPDESWATGTDPAVNSHAQRLRALNPALTVRNLAVSGATVADLQAQAQAARDLNNGQGVDYVTISIGPNDFCVASALPGDTITPSATFESRLRSAMQTLMTNNPHKPRVLLGSVINPASYYDALAGVGAPAVQRWLFYQFCANVTGYTTPYAQVGAVTTPPTDATVVASRAAAGALSVSYSNAVQTVCAEFAPYCRYDGGAANTYTAFQVADASTQDYWHPAVSGQAKFADLWWNAGFNW